VISNANVILRKTPIPSAHADLGIKQDGFSMKIITCNVNGIRSAAKKGFFDWLALQKADFICLQEVRAKEDQIPELPASLKKYHAAHSFAEKAGYSGVTIYSKQVPDKVIDKMGLGEMDREGRFVQVDVGSLSVASVYFPSGSANEDRQEVKYGFMDSFAELAKKNKRKKRSYVYCGDYNIAHKQIDIKNWRSNQKNSGFLPEERAWMDVLFDDIKYVDAFRVKNLKEEEYTWWSNRGNAYNNNVGWRLDYQVVSASLEDKIKSVSTFKKQKFSDHAPVIVNYDI